MLDWVQLVPLGEPFDRADLRAFGLHCEHQAGAHWASVQQHGAGAAHAVLAAEMRAGQATILAQRVGQAAPRFDLDRARLAVDGERDLQLFRHCGRLRCSRTSCTMRCGVIGISKMSMANGESASVTAFSTAPGAPIAPPSPTPFTPVMLASVIVSRWWISRSGISDMVGTR